MESEKTVFVDLETDTEVATVPTESLSGLELEEDSIIQFGETIYRIERKIVPEGRNLPERVCLRVDPTALSVSFEKDKK